MAGVMYLGNQMVSPVIIQGGGIDPNKYESLPYISFYGKDYIDFKDKEKALNLDYSLLPIYKIDRRYRYFGDKVTLNCFDTSSSHFTEIDSVNGFGAINSTQVFFEGDYNTAGTLEEFVLEGLIGFGAENLFIRAKRIIIDNTKIGEQDFGGVAFIQYSTRIKADSLNLDNYIYLEEYSDGSCIMDNTYLEVTENLNNKVLDFYKLEGSLGFFVRTGDLSTFTFTIKTTEDFSNLGFLNNNFYNISIVDREDGSYYYKDITIAPKDKVELVSMGYTESEADSLLALFTEPFTDVNKNYTEKPSSLLSRQPKVYDNALFAPFYYLSNVIGNIKPTLIELAQKSTLENVKRVLSGNGCVGLLGNITKIGSCYPVIKKDTNTKGFIDTEDGTFYPFVKVPFIIIFNTNYENCIFSYEIDGVPVNESSNIIEVPGGSTLTYTITKAQEGEVKYNTVSGTITPFEDQRINVNLLRTYKLSVITNYDNCNYSYYNSTKGEYLPDTTPYVYVFSGDQIRIKVTKEAVDNIQFSTETEYVTVTEDITVEINLNRTYTITFDGYQEDISVWYKKTTYRDDRKITSPTYVSWGNDSYEYFRASKTPNNGIYYNYQELASNYTITSDATLQIDNFKEFRELGTFVRPNLTANGTLWVDNFAVDAPAYSTNYQAWKAFDGNSSTYWRTASNNDTLTITLKKPVALSSMTFTFNSVSTSGGVSIYGLVKNQDGTVSSLFLASELQPYSATQITVDLSEKPCAFYGYSIAFNKSSGTCYVKEITMVGKELEEVS